MKYGYIDGILNEEVRFGHDGPIVNIEQFEVSWVDRPGSPNRIFGSLPDLPVQHLLDVPSTRVQIRFSDDRLSWTNLMNLHPVENVLDK